MKPLLRQQEKVIEVLTEDDQQLNRLRQRISDIISKIDDFSDKKALEVILYLLAQSKLFASNTVLGIKDYEIIKLNSDSKISRKRTKTALDYLQENKFIKLISARPKQHVLNF